MKHAKEDISKVEEALKDAYAGGHGARPEINNSWRESVMAHVRTLGVPAIEVDDFAFNLRLISRFACASSCVAVLMLLIALNMGVVSDYGIPALLGDPLSCWAGDPVGIAVMNLLVP
jgi:hypothetical protein